MKKQISILIVALFAISFSNVYGQAPNLSAAATCPVPTAITCLAADALHPVAGTPYNYTVAVPTPVSGTKTYNWFVTQDQNFIVGSSLVAAVEASLGGGAHIQATGTGYNNTTTGSTTMNITWKSFTHDPNAPVFLVIYVQNAGTCTTDNIEVYVIQPLHAFTLDIANIGINGSAQGANYATCVSPVVGASYLNGTVQMDYGVNYLFFIVTAANFTGSWQPSFQIGGAGIAGTRAVTAVDWAYPTTTGNGTWNATAGSGAAWTASGATVTNVAAQGGTTVGTAGECIIVRVTVDNNQAETIIDAPVSLAVDGIMLNPGTGGGYATLTLGDVHHANGQASAGPPVVCNPLVVDGFANDVVTQVITARPDINAVTPTPFVPTNRD